MPEFFRPKASIPYFCIRKPRRFPLFLNSYLIFHALDDETNTGKRYSIDQSLVKAQKYCAYQERSQQEVRDKLYTFGLHKNQVEELISRLISDGFLKEERFAIAYATGKFRSKKWGVIKIRHGL